MRFTQLSSFSRSTSAMVSVAAMLTSVLVVLPGQALEFPPSNNRGAPARTAGGGVRGDNCAAAEQAGQLSLTALTPGNNVGTTTAAGPMLFFYVPQVSDKSAEFLLMDEAGKDVYVTTIQLPKTAGVIQIKLPEQTKDKKDLLTLSKSYIWRISIICDASDRTRDLSLEGGIERGTQKPELKKAIEKVKTDPLKVAELYAKAGIWQETLMYAAKARQTKPTTWTQLLKSVGLEKLANAPFVK